ATMLNANNSDTNAMGTAVQVTSSFLFPVICAGSRPSRGRYLKRMKTRSPVTSARMAPQIHMHAFHSHSSSAASGAAGSNTLMCIGKLLRGGRARYSQARRLVTVLGENPRCVTTHGRKAESSRRRNHRDFSNRETRACPKRYTLAPAMTGINSCGSVSRLGPGALRLGGTA